MYTCVVLLPLKLFKNVNDPEMTLELKYYKEKNVTRKVTYKKSFHETTHKDIICCHQMFVLKDNVCVRNTTGRFI